MSNNVLLNKAERFAALIDLDDPPLMLDGGDPGMRPAVALTAALRSAGASATPQPLSSSAKTLMRERLVAAAAATSAATAPVDTASLGERISHAAEHGQQRAVAAGRRIGKRMSALVGSVVILTSVTGVGVAAARSTPGSPFYELKKATESVQLWLASGQSEKGQRHLQFARTRLAEAQRLPADSPYLAATLKAMNDETRRANTDLVKTFRATGSAKPLEDLVTFARAQSHDLAKLGATLPKDLRKQATYSTQLLTGVTDEVKSLTGGLCPTCGSAHHPTTTPGATKPTVAPTPGAAKPTTNPATHPTHAPTSHHPTKATHPSATPNKNPLPKLSPIPLLSSLAQLLGVG